MEQWNSELHCLFCNDDEWERGLCKTHFEQRAATVGKPITWKWLESIGLAGTKRTLPCIELDCNNLIYAKFLCRTHYHAKRYGPRKRPTKPIRPRCAAEGCKSEAWRGRRKRDDGKEWEVRWLYAEDKQYCSNHRPKFDTAAPPREVFTKEWMD